MFTTADTHKKKSLLGTAMKYLVPLVVTVGLCWVMFRHIDYRDMMAVIRHHCDFWWIGLALALSIVSHVARALRWRIQLKALGIYPSRWELVLSIFGTYSINLVFPRLGEVWRSGFIAHRQDAPFATVFGSMLAERVADFVTVFIMLVGAFAIASTTLVKYLMQNEQTYHRVMEIALSPWTWLAIVALVVVAWRALVYKSASGSLLSKAQQFVQGIWRGFASIATMPGKVRWIAYTVWLWGCYFVQMYVAFYAFPFTAQALAEYGIAMVFVTFVLSSISMGVPSNGGIGPWQWAVMFAMGMYGIDKVESAAFANLVLGSQTLLLIVLGLFTFIAIMISGKRHPLATTADDTDITNDK